MWQSFKTTLKVLSLLIFSDVYPHGSLYSTFWGSVALISSGVVFAGGPDKGLTLIGVLLASIGLFFYLLTRLLLLAIKKSGHPVRWLDYKSQLLVIVLCLIAFYSWSSRGYSLIAIPAIVIAHTIVMWRINGVEILETLTKSTRR